MIKLLRYEIVGEYKLVYILEDIIEIVDNIIVSEKRNHRRIIAPGDSAEGESQEIKDIVALLHTPELVSQYQEFVAAQD